MKLAWKTSLCSLIALVTLCTNGVLINRLHAAQGNSIAWTPDVFEITLFRGTAKAALLQFTADRDIADASLFVVPEIAGLLSVEPSSLGTVVHGQVYTLQAGLEAQLSVPAGTYEGTVHLRSAQRTIPETLKVLVHVVEPTSIDIPAEIALPSSDRITTNLDGHTLVKDEIIVILDFDIADPESRVREIASSTGAVIVGAVPVMLAYQLRYEVEDLNALQDRRLLLQSQTGVTAAVRHYLTDPAADFPDDARYDSWDEGNPSGNNWNLEYIKAPSAWDIVTGDPSVAVAVIDVDTHTDHEDLANNVNHELSSGARSCNPDGNGGCTHHGTHVCGIACAEGNNNQGVAGVAWHCSLRVYDYLNVPRSRRLSSAMVAANRMVRAAMEGARIVNISSQWIDNNKCKDWASIFTDNPMREARTLDAVADHNATFGRAIRIARRLRQSQGKPNVLWIFAAGNECRDVKYASPASLSLSREFNSDTMAIAAIEETGELWFDTLLFPTGETKDFGSNFGAATVAAPGRNVLSTLPVDCQGADGDTDCRDEYDRRKGTSMAAPHVSGLAALVLSEHPDFTAAQVKQCIVNAAQLHGRAVPGHNFRVISAPEAVRCEFEPGQVTYTVTDLGARGGCPGGTAVAYDINNNGDVAGVTCSIDGRPHAFLWTTSASLQDLGALGSGVSYGRGINDSRHVVGWFESQSGNRAFLWTPTDGMRDLGTLAQVGGDVIAVSSAAYAINNLGEVVGESSHLLAPNPSGISGGSSGFVWSASNGMRALPLWRAFAINSAGDAAGTALTLTSPLQFEGPAVSLGGITTRLTGGIGSAFDINDSVEAVGAARLVGTTEHAFVWTAGAGIQDLGHLGANFSFAYGVNNRRQIVGSSMLGSFPFPSHAVIWERDSVQGVVMTDLNTRIDSNSGWILSEARAINDKGQIVGWGILNGEQRAFLLTPQPSP